MNKSAFSNEFFPLFSILFLPYGHALLSNGGTRDFGCRLFGLQNEVVDDYLSGGLELNLVQKEFLSANRPILKFCFILN